MTTFLKAEICNHFDGTQDLNSHLYTSPLDMERNMIAGAKTDSGSSVWHLFPVSVLFLFVVDFIAKLYLKVLELFFLSTP